MECGISARYMSDPIDVVIFNFTDKNLHNNNADLSFIYDTTVREILRQDVRSVLREMPEDAVVFVTSDHGFAPCPNDLHRARRCCTDSEDVKYRVGRLKSPLEGRTPRTACLSRSATSASRTRPAKASSGRSTTSCSPAGPDAEASRRADSPSATRTAA